MADAAEPEINEEEEMPEQDIFYVAESELKSLKEKLKESKDISKEDVDKLTFPENLPDDAMMVPVDMRGVEEEFDDVEQMVEKLGPKGAAEAFIKARDFFEANNKGEDAAQPMTAKEWSQVLEEDAMDDQEGCEDEMFMEGEEDEFLDEEPEEEGEEGDDAEEPAAKKAKTD
jgi:hypothetical protein